MRGIHFCGCHDEDNESERDGTQESEEVGPVAVKGVQLYRYLVCKMRAFDNHEEQNESLSEC